MSTVITKEQAKKILKGRTPLVPVEYETAIAALVACANLDEAKYWDNKADALAAWAKIYHSDEAERKAKMLKLHAYRRMGQLAGELRPGGNRQPGPMSLLMEQGLKSTQATAARKLSTLTEIQFERVMKHPCAPTTVAERLSGTEPAWRDFASHAQALDAFTRVNKPAAFMRAIDPKRYSMLRELALGLIEWLDELEQKLPKEKANGKG